MKVHSLQVINNKNIKEKKTVVIKVPSNFSEQILINQQNEGLMNEKKPKLLKKFPKLGRVLSKINSILNLFFKFFCVCFTIKRNQPMSLQEKLKTKNYEIPILNFFKLLLNIIRAKELFRARTYYRSMNKIKRFHLNLLDDYSFFKKEDEKQFNSFKTISLGKVLRKMKKKFRRVFKQIAKISSKFKKFIKKTLKLYFLKAL